ncbi:molybdenum cofactor biosynthesis protein MoaC [Filimonas lacunae]|uniref:Molybdopterin adenylyltransferase n=1 Tax=Filimonas lacunae TaxID=477680 RepID=A0A173MHR5_9BACT|nr:bifunctional molybdenum cofactor biosynthesis protein MoaC/MoaB [Filimonas lacunae]BAV07039.1 molybdenum cofactor biosynthesis protein [Filimonas lacunae]SIS95888.1 molybdenum cofactor biosynthesis protein MoaC [Filimonas lacunae]
MVNITHKQNTLRKAVAQAIVQVSGEATMQAIHNRQVPKGDVFEFSRAAGLLAIKKTSDVIPDCHPLPVEYAAFTYQTSGLQITITAEVHTIYKTGVEVEAMHGAMIAALTMYDMLKPIDSRVEIGSVTLQQKKGGKSDHPLQPPHNITCAVVVCSDRASKGEYEDVSGKLLVSLLEQRNLPVAEYAVVPDDIAAIQQIAQSLQTQGYDLVLFTGGTGVSPRDVTPEAITPLLTQPVPGIAEAARSYGMQRTPMAMLSRSVAGFMHNTLLVTLPGSPNAVRESVDALFPALLHVFTIRHQS